MGESRCRITVSQRPAAQFHLGPREEAPYRRVPLPEVDFGGLQHADGLIETTGGVERPGHFDRHVVAPASVGRNHPEGVHGVCGPPLREQQPGKVAVQGLVLGPSFDRLPQTAFSFRRPARDLPVDHREGPMGGGEPGIQRGRSLPGGGRLLVAAEAPEQVAEEQAGGSRCREHLGRRPQRR